MREKKYRERVREEKEIRMKKREIESVGVLERERERGKEMDIEDIYFCIVTVAYYKYVSVYWSNF